MGNNQKKEEDTHHINLILPLHFSFKSIKYENTKMLNTITPPHTVLAWWCNNKQLNSFFRDQICADNKCQNINLSVMRCVIRFVWIDVLHLPFHMSGGHRKVSSSCVTKHHRLHPTHPLCHEGRCFHILKPKYVKLYSRILILAWYCVYERFVFVVCEDTLLCVCLYRASCGMVNFTIPQSSYAQNWGLFPSFPIR